MDKQTLKILLVISIIPILAGGFSGIENSLNRYPENLGYLVFPFLFVIALAIISFFSGVLTIAKKYGRYFLLASVLLPTGFFAGCIGGSSVINTLDIGYYPADPINWDAKTASFTIFKPGVTKEQIESFEHEVFYSHEPDVGFFDYGYSRIVGIEHQGSKVLYFRFHTRTSKDKREYVYQKIRSSPLVQELQIDVSSDPFNDCEQRQTCAFRW